MSTSGITCKLLVMAGANFPWVKVKILGESLRGVFLPKALAKFLAKSLKAQPSGEVKLTGPFISGVRIIWAIAHH